MPMMGMMGGMPMNPMAMGAPSDPKTMGRMMQFHADMMRAMADVMAKHGKALEAGQ
jgi:hypothetical protein